MGSARDTGPPSVFDKLHREGGNIPKSIYPIIISASTPSISDILYLFLPSYLVRWLLKHLERVWRVGAYSLSHLTIHRNIQKIDPTVFVQNPKGGELRFLISETLCSIGSYNERTLP